MFPRLSNEVNKYFLNFAKKYSKYVQTQFTNVNRYVIINLYNYFKKIKSRIYTERKVLHMKIVVCIGSSCHLKGSRQVVERLRELIEKYAVGDKVELGGTFCIGECQKGVCVTVDEEFHSVTPENVDGFFAEAVLAKLK